MHKHLLSSKLARRILWAAIGVAASPAVMAQCFGYYCSGVIQSMTITSDVVYVRLFGDLAGLTNCTPYSQVYLTLPKSDPNYSSYYATLLAAYMAKESVTLRPIDSSPNCTISYAAVP